jgi:hypothetical protein
MESLNIICGYWLGRNEGPCLRCPNQNPKTNDLYDMKVIQLNRAPVV